MAPYGTGSFDLIVDRHALINCIESNLGAGFYQPQVTDEYTPINENNNWTPNVGKTPDPYRTLVGGATSIYTPNPEGELTPKYHQSMSQSPIYRGGSMHYGGGTPVSSSPY